MKFLLTHIFLCLTFVSCSHNGKWEAKGMAGHAYIDAQEACTSCFACDCLDYYEDHRHD